MTSIISGQKLDDSYSTKYYFDPVYGSAHNDGLSAHFPFKSLSHLADLKLKGGDSILLKAGMSFNEPLVLHDQKGAYGKPIVITTYDKAVLNPFASIQLKGYANGLELENCSFIEVNNLSITAQAASNGVKSNNIKMRCGVLINISKTGTYQHIYLKNIKVHDVFYESPSFKRPANEVKTANGTQRYGWGVRLINGIEDAYLRDIKLEALQIENVAHTGIKLTGKKQGNNYSISDVQISNSKVNRTGGPGIQMSGISNGHIFDNEVDQSGSDDDSRKWGRGSGLWTWSCSNILIEKNRFTNAHGPGDSAGAHIDFNCSNIVLQYNFSANNAGGFCEILGNNFNCAYRYNISVNDGYRIKGVDGAFQEGKVFWLSGYAGTNSDRHGPFNSYFYNNTIVVNQEIEAKIAIDRVADGVLIANNIFSIQGEAKSVKGDQYKPESDGEFKVKDVFFKNNLFLHSKSWPLNIQLQDSNPIFGDPEFVNISGLDISDFTPLNMKLIKDQGIIIPALANDSIGLVYGLKVEKDILGNYINANPDLGAIELPD